MSERIFAGAHLSNRISAVDNDLFVGTNAHHRLVYYLAYSNIQYKQYRAAVNSNKNLNERYSAVTVIE